LKVPSATQWTVAADNRNRILYYHTAWNRRVRSVDLKSIDFDNVKLHTIPMDKDRMQDIEEVSVQ
jgi:predicted amidohydrolase YtcJ